MFGIADIIKAITENKIKISDHADEEAESDELKFDEVCYSVLQGEVIESYPDDKPYPSCLIFGRSFVEIQSIVFGDITKKRNGWL